MKLNTKVRSGRLFRFPHNFGPYDVVAGGRQPRRENGTRARSRDNENRVDVKEEIMKAPGMSLRRAIFGLCLAVGFGFVQVLGVAQNYTPATKAFEPSGSRFASITL